MTPACVKGVIAYPCIFGGSKKKIISYYDTNLFKNFTNLLINKEKMMLSEYEIRDMLTEIVVSGLLTKNELREVIRSLGCKVTGVVGPFVLRYKNNKLIISYRPVNFQMSGSQKAQNARRIHGAATKFAKFIYNIEPLKKTWKDANLLGHNVFNKIIKYNKKNLVDGIPSEKNILCPSGFQIGLENIVSWQNGKIKIEKECESNLVIVLIPYDPIDQSHSSFECINIHCSPAAEGEIHLTDEQLTVCRKYKRFTLYAAAIEEVDGNTIWSNTITQQGKFEFIFNVNFTEAENLGYGQIVNSPKYLFYLQVKLPRYSTPLPELKPK